MKTLDQIRTVEESTKEQLIRCVQSLMESPEGTRDYLITLEKDDLVTLICRLS